MINYTITLEDAEDAVETIARGRLVITVKDEQLYYTDEVFNFDNIRLWTEHPTFFEALKNADQEAADAVIFKMSLIDKPADADHASRVVEAVEAWIETNDSIDGFDEYWSDLHKPSELGINESGYLSLDEWKKFTNAS